MVGARPQFVKCAPLSKELRKFHHEIIIHTGQHYDYEMSKIFFDELNIPKPDYNLNIGSGTQGHQTGNMLSAIEDILVKEEPNLVVVFGDTNSTLAGAIAAVKVGIPIVHIEAGLRSFNRAMPEEVNRVLTDHVSDILFAPTKGAVASLGDEGIRKGVSRVGDITVDALDIAKKIAISKSGLVSQLGLAKREYHVLTIHRAGSTDNPAKIGSVLSAVHKATIPVVFPVHPRTRKVLNELFSSTDPPSNLILIAPLSYAEMITLIMNARGVLTDSGGVQKESFLLGTRCTTLREETEWKETLVDGRNSLVGLDEGKIVKALHLPPLGSVPRYHPFGTVGVAKRMLRIINSYLGSKFP